MPQVKPAMIIHCVRFGLAAAAVTLWQPAPAEACSCGGTIPPSVALRHAEIVFVGTVARIDRPTPTVLRHQNADGSVTVGFNPSSRVFVLFDVEHAFKGPAPEQIVVTDNLGSSCGVGFKTGETWLVYGRERVDGVTPIECSRTRLVSEAEQDLLYLRNGEARRLQGIVYGNVHRRRNGPSGVALYALFEPLQVTAANATHRFVTTTDRWGPFELVLPPGDYQVWVGREGKPVSPRTSVRVEHGADTRLHLIAE